MVVKVKTNLKFRKPGVLSAQEVNFLKLLAKKYTGLFIDISEDTVSFVIEGICPASAEELHVFLKDNKSSIEITHFQRMVFASKKVVPLTEILKGEIEAFVKNAFFPGCSTELLNLAKNGISNITQRYTKYLELEKEVYEKKIEEIDEDKNEESHEALPHSSPQCGFSSQSEDTIAKPEEINRKKTEDQNMKLSLKTELEHAMESLGTQRNLEYEKYYLGLHALVIDFMDKRVGPKNHQEALRKYFGLSIDSKSVVVSNVGSNVPLKEPHYPLNFTLTFLSSLSSIFFRASDFEDDFGDFNCASEKPLVGFNILERSISQIVFNNEVPSCAINYTENTAQFSYMCDVPEPSRASFETKLLLAIFTSGLLGAYALTNITYADQLQVMHAASGNSNSVSSVNPMHSLTTQLNTANIQAPVSVVKQNILSNTENSKMLIQVKLKKSNGVMPWYWMALLSTKCPGQYYYVDNAGEEYVIFSGKGMPSNLQDIPMFLINHPVVHSIVGVTIMGVSMIEDVPKSAIPLFSKLYQEGMLNMSRAAGRSREAALGVQTEIKTRYEILLKRITNCVDKGQKYFDNEFIFLLEKTASNLECMANTVKDGDIGRSTSYISNILLQDTDVDTALSTKIPNDEKDATCQTFTFTQKINNPDFELDGDAKQFILKIAKRLGLIAELVCTNNNQSSVDIVLHNYSVSGEYERMIFLEKIRTVLYASALDGFYDLKWASSTVVKKELKAENADLTDDEEEYKLHKTIIQIVDSSQLDKELKLNWNKVGNGNKIIPGLRINVLPPTFFSQAQAMSDKLAEKGFSVQQGTLKSGDIAVQVTLRKK